MPSTAALRAGGTAHTESTTPPKLDPFQSEAVEPHAPERPKITHGRATSVSVSPELLHSRLGHFRDLTWVPRVVEDELPKSSWVMTTPCNICLC